MASRSTSRRVLIVTTLAVLLAAPVQAATIEGVQFADTLAREGAQLRINCVGLLRYMRFIKAYVAALYLGDGVVAGDVLSDVPKRLELNYFYSIKGSDFGTAADQILAKNVDATTMQQLRPRLDRLNALYQDVRPGNRYSLTYIPGHGTELALDNVTKGVIEGADFAAAYFSIWLGKEPMDVSLRDQLLRCS